jgi:enoyl-CoA hydratase/carnithine racemase
MLNGEAQSLAGILEAEAQAQRLCLQSPEFKAGIEAFLNRK